MTNAEIIAIFKSNFDESFSAALRGVYNAGYYEGAGVTPTTNGVDQSKVKSKPTAIVRVRHQD